MNWFGASIFALVALGCGACTAFAEVGKMKAELKASNEVPPNSSTATGSVEATLDTSSRSLTWLVNYAGLSGPAVGAHFHGPGEPGKNAGIVLPFKSPLAPIQGEAVLTEIQAADVLAGKWYVNVHTERNPGGEIRGQLVR